MKKIIIVILFNLLLLVGNANCATLEIRQSANATNNITTTPLSVGNITVAGAITIDAIQLTLSNTNNTPAGQYLYINFSSGQANYRSQISREVLLTGTTKSYPVSALVLPAGTYAVSLSISGGGQLQIKASSADGATFTGPYKLGFFRQPISAIAGQNISSANPNQISIGVYDVNNVLLTDATNRVIISMGNNPGAGSLSGSPQSADAINGYALFPSLSINKSGVGYTLVAESSGLLSSSSASFNITSGMPSLTLNGTKLTAEPSSVIADGESASTLTVTLQDQYGNQTVDTVSRRSSVSNGN